mmetsp:Transcript_22017/g.26911  ORF Transcript_22017/g.26911 Transcript_22017/m.26911 type:complete len:506 (+) Transcript_22017:162-1679(+)
MASQSAHNKSFVSNILSSEVEHADGGLAEIWINRLLSETNTDDEYFAYVDDASHATDGDVQDTLYANDITVDGVLAALTFNICICSFLILVYEVLRRYIPAIYSGRNRHISKSRQVLVDIQSDTYLPLAWIPAVWSIPWEEVRRSGGLDAYMFLRFIGMCLRITCVCGLWMVIILGPVFATGGGDATGWYHLSMSNVKQSNWRIWCPTICMWLMSGYVMFTMEKEYEHYHELRMEFLSRGNSHINPQHHYSIKVESIPLELRSSIALQEYFELLFPGKVHSASVILKVPELDVLSARRKRVTRRLEKAIAYYEATGKRPTHIVGRPRLMLCGIETEPVSMFPCYKEEANDDTMTENDFDFDKGHRADSITYYFHDLNRMNRQVMELQRETAEIAENGSVRFTSQNWTENLRAVASSAVAAIGLEGGIFFPSEKEDSCHKEYGSFDFIDLPLSPGHCVDDQNFHEMEESRLSQSTLSSKSEDSVRVTPQLYPVLIALNKSGFHMKA